jgi:hypothetical protein
VEDAPVRRTFHVYYCSSAIMHYLDLATQEVEIAGDEAEIELDGQRVRCLIQGVGGLAPDQPPHTTLALYLQRKEEKHTAKRSGSQE